MIKKTYLEICEAVPLGYTTDMEANIDIIEGLEVNDDTPCLVNFDGVFVILETGELYPILYSSEVLQYVV
jgi:hypothetical protein